MYLLSSKQVLIRLRVRENAVKLMMFGAALLSGEGFAGAAQAANSVGNFNKERIDALYADRKKMN